MYKKLLAVSLAAVLLSACSGDKAEQKPTLSCNDPAVLQSVKTNIQDIVKQDARSYARSDALQFVDADKIIAAATQLEISLENPAEIQEGGKTLCSAGLKIQIPTDIMKTAETNSPLVYNEVGLIQWITRKINGSGLSFDQGAFQTELRYTPSQTDGANFEDNTLTATAQTLSAALMPYGIKSIVMIDGEPVSREQALKLSSEKFAEPSDDSSPDPQDILDNNAASGTSGLPDDTAASSAEVLNPVETLSDHTAQADLDAARDQNRRADEEVNRVWRSMDGSIRKTLQSEQRSWIQNKQQNCQRAAAQADDPAQAEYRRLQCETRMSRERVQYLKGYTIN
ncbi:lysozyme inhibitor LprI family protein [Neisseria chenwenguii]|uniref:Lysozyme inhibitor LprI-like N-terminal domain-containing protein n=1 Tax=Neisseria chenwenguii TaxID=1853278 RepID=A0A220S0U5_9NEIS|nr:lysozyme inhibitor LprI family protein [Neisseria chenwenguii]ASK26996.1 hypothetical protein BG910_03905 [Neisseria chenwenguii]ROV56103.1 DUF1311 domain-containing protein [Neisseria chenwenguii]